MSDELDNLIKQASQKRLSDFVVWLSLMVGRGNKITTNHHKIISQYIKAYLEDITEFNP